MTTIFVTHDQDEALEVADEVAVVNNGRVEQVRSPDILYDHPANDFVMGFLGPVTRLGKRAAPISDAVEAKVTRLQRVGFEVHAELLASDPEPWVQLTRAQAESLALRPGDTVWVRPVQDASTLAAS